MTRRDGLKKLYLVKSAGYEFQELDLEKNTLLLGDSGVGKTTIMRAVLFFYTMDYSDTMLNINPDTKKSFNDWYFKEHNSHLVYEYTKADSRFLFIVSKSGKLHYTFVDITNTSLNVETLFLEGNLPLNLEKLNENIARHNLPSFATTKRELYINTFHKKDENSRKIKQDSNTNFTLFESVGARKEFAKTLSNIFASSKVSSQSLKKSIVSLINDSHASINLNVIKQNLSEFISEKNEIENFEKKIPTVEKLALVHNSYKESKMSFKTLANTLEAFKQNIAIEIEKNSVQLLTLSQLQESNKIDFKVEAKGVQEKITTKDGELSVAQNEIQKLKEKQSYYASQNIEELLLKHNDEQNSQNTLANATNRYEALTQGTQNIKLKYQKLQEQLDKDLQLISRELQTSQSVMREKINHKINELVLSKDKRIQDSSKISQEEKERLSLMLSQNTAELTQTKVSLGETKHFPFNKENIVNFEKEIKSFEKELSDTKLLQAQNTHEIQRVEEDIAKLARELKSDTTALDEKIAKEKDLLFTQKVKTERRLDFESDNLYGYLNKNNIKNRDKILTYLKDEILFSPKPFSVKQIVHDTALFGLEVTFEDAFSNEYQQVKLLEELHLIKEKIKDLNKKISRKKRDLEENAQLQTKEKNRQRAILYIDKERLQEKSTSYAKGIEIANENLKHAQKEAKKQLKEAMERLHKEFASLEVMQQNLETSIENVEAKLQSIKDEITQSIEEKVFNFKEEIQELEILTKQKIADAQESHKQSSQNIQDELSDALKEEGVDEKLLANISTEMQTLKNRLSSIEENRLLVMVYLSEYKEKILTLPEQISAMQENQKLHDELKNALVALKNRQADRLKEFDKARVKLDTIKNNLEKFSLAYREKIENQNIHQAIQKSLTPQTPSLTQTLESQPNKLVDEIVALYAKIKTDETKIESLVNNCRLVLKPNNIFKITIENDYIDSTSYLKTAKELIEYVKKDKLSLFKELSSEVFKRSLISIKKDLALFEDAMLDVESEIIDLRNTINRAVNSFNVIDNIKIRFESSNHQILNSLKSLSSFYDENNEKFLSGLFLSQLDESHTQKIQEELSVKISDLNELLKSSKEFIELEDGFVLEFKVVENGNDLKWRQTLNDIGSNGTSTLVKSIINISMLQMVSKNITKETQILSHCILDEIGTISTDYFRELKDFVNRSGFVFLNGMPIEDDMLISMYPTIYVGQKHSNYSRMILASTMEI